MTWTGNVGGGSPTTTASFGGLPPKTVSYANGGAPLGPTFRLGTDVRGTTPGFTASYDDFGIDW